MLQKYVLDESFKLSFQNTKMVLLDVPDDVLRFQKEMFNLGVYWNSNPKVLRTVDRRMKLIGIFSGNTEDIEKVLNLLKVEQAQNITQSSVMTVLNYNAFSRLGKIPDGLKYVSHFKAKSTYDNYLTDLVYEVVKYVNGNTTAGRSALKSLINSLKKYT